MVSGYHKNFVERNCDIQESFKKLSMCCHIKIKKKGKGECIKVGDMIDIPMIDHSFEKRAIMGFVSKKKGITITKVEAGETGQIEFIVNNIHSGRIKTESNLYTDEDYSGAVTAYFSSNNRKHALRTFYCHK